LNEVLRVLVKREFSNLLERLVGVRPSLGNVEGDVTGFLGLLGRHSLDVHDPRWEVSTLDSVEHVDDVASGGSQNRALLELYVLLTGRSLPTKSQLPSSV